MGIASRPYVVRPVDVDLVPHGLLVEEVRIQKPESSHKAERGLLRATIPPRVRSVPGRPELSRPRSPLLSVWTGVMGCRSSCPPSPHD